MSKSAASIGVVWAVCDHFEKKTNQPVLAPVLKQVCGVTREQLRKWVKQGRLNEYTMKLPNKQLVKGYTRPKELQSQGGTNGN